MTKITWCLHIDYNKKTFDVVPLSRPMLCLLLHVGEEHCTAVSCHAVHKWFGTGTMGNGRGGILTRSFSLAYAPQESHLPLLLVLVFSSANTFSAHLTYEMLFFTESTTWCSALLSPGDMRKEAEVYPPTFEKFSAFLKSSVTSCWRKPKTFCGKSQPVHQRSELGSLVSEPRPLPLQYFAAVSGYRDEGLRDHTWAAGTQYPLPGHLFCSKPCLKAATPTTALGGDFGAVEHRVVMI